MSIGEVWKFMHDGGIERIDGCVPGDVTVFVSIRYLRQRFPGAGTGFLITLTNCTRFEYAPYDEPPCRDLAAIIRLEPEILSLASDDPVVVNCAMGTLNLTYDSASVALDTGAPISTAQLSEASSSYWDEWSRRSRGDI